MKKLYLFTCLSFALTSMCAEEEKAQVGKELWQAAKPYAKIGTGITTLGIHVFYWLFGGKEVGDVEGLGLKLKTLLEGTLLPEGTLRDESEIKSSRDYSDHPILYRAGNVALLTVPIIPSWYLIQSGIDDLRKKNEQKPQTISEENHDEQKQELDTEVQWYLKAKNKAKDLVKKAKESIIE